jgi:hypothetical protein
MVTMETDVEEPLTLVQSSTPDELIKQSDPSLCPRFGMVTMETDVEELLTLVINTGRDIDEAVAQLQTMSEVLADNICLGIY